MSESYQSWVRGLRPVLEECDYSVVAPDLPDDLSGTLYRCGPSQRILPTTGFAGLHLFDGDGLVHRFELGDKRVRCKSQFVRSASFLSEQRAGSFNQHALGSRCERPTRDVRLRQQHNTNVVIHAGRLLALVENAPPVEIADYERGVAHEQRFGIRLGARPLSAHPKIVADTGEMFIHSCFPREPYLTLYCVDQRGQKRWQTALPLAQAAWVHDIGVTPNFLLIPVSPVAIDMAFEDGLPVLTSPFKTIPDQPLRWLICSRADGSLLHSIDGGSTDLVVHVGRAAEEAGRLLVEGVGYAHAGAYLRWLREARAGGVVPHCLGRYVRYTLDLQAGRYHAHTLVERAVEFPRLNDAALGSATPRYSYLAVGPHPAHSPNALPWNGIAKLDSASDRIEEYVWRGRWIGEPVFAPRPGGGEEDEGYVMTVAYDPSSDGSSLEILDARALASGPCTSVPLPKRVPFGFHGSYVAGAASVRAGASSHA